LSSGSSSGGSVGLVVGCGSCCCCSVGVGDSVGLVVRDSVGLVVGLVVGGSVRLVVRDCVGLCRNLWNDRGSGRFTLVLAAAEIRDSQHYRIA